MIGVLEMFAEFSSPDAYEVQAATEMYIALKRESVGAATSEWKRNHIARVREHNRKSMANRYAADAEYRARKKAEAKQRYQQRREDPAFRERMRQNAARQLQRKQEARAA